MIAVALVGESAAADERAAALSRNSRTIRVAAKNAARDADAIFLSGDAVHDVVRLQEMARQGVHLFLDATASMSMLDWQALARLTEEAGIEIGVSRPLRFHPIVDEVRARGHVNLIRIASAVDATRMGAWKTSLWESVDLGLALAGGGSWRRIDASVARRGDRLPLSIAAGIRFQNSSYAQLALVHDDNEASTITAHVAGPDFSSDVCIPPNRADLVGRETEAFLQAISANRPPPVSVLDALQSMRLMEKLMERLR